MRQRNLLPVICGAFLAVAGCDRDQPNPISTDPEVDGVLDDDLSGEADLTVAKVEDGFGVPATTHTYEITLENLTDDNGGGAAQVLSPPVIATHHKRARMWQRGQLASPELAGVAEDALNGPLVDLLAGADGVHEVQSGENLILPGGSDTWVVHTVASARRLSLASMLVNTNDAFTGTDALWLPWWGEKTFYLRAYDAGSEENTELKAHIPGPCCGDTGSNGNPTQEPIRPHRGLHGEGELDPDLYGWEGPVAKLTVRRLAPTWEITVANLTPNHGDGAAQVFSPPLMAVHANGFRMWKRGRMASGELAAIAEDALYDGMLDLLDGSDRVGDVVMGGELILPGAEDTYTVEGAYRMHRLSMAFMLVNTNDAFSGADAIRLPRGGRVAYTVGAYDAGSEENDELEAHIPGPCCGDMGQNGTPTRERIRHHEGITGRGDLAPELWGWEGPVGMLTITRTQ